MKYLTIFTAALLALNACSHQTEPNGGTLGSTESEQPLPVKPLEESTAPNLNRTVDYSEFEPQTNQIPPDGTYRFDLAFAEWDGKSMGEGVTVIVTGDSITVIYEGDGTLTLTEKGEVMDHGQLIKHKSGDWIISTNPADKDLDEVGGCTGGPAIIDFKNKKYWLC